MKYSEAIYSKAEAELKARRIKAEQLGEMRRNEIAAKYPELLEIEKIMRETALFVIRSVGAGGERVDISQLAKSNLEAQEKKRNLLKNKKILFDKLNDA